MWRTTLLPITSCYVIALTCCTLWAVTILAMWDVHHIASSSCHAIFEGNIWALLWPVGLLGDFALRFSGTIQKRHGHTRMAILRYVFVLPGLPALSTLLFVLARGIAFMKFKTLPAACLVNFLVSYGLQLTCVLLAVTMLPYFVVLYREQLRSTRRIVAADMGESADIP